MGEFMNIYLIEDYVRRLQYGDVERFALKQGIVLDNEELTIVYEYIRKEYKTCSLQCDLVESVKKCINADF